MADIELQDDPQTKKTQDILEQLGLHPSQLDAQDHLARVYGNINKEATEPKADVAVQPDLVQVPKAETPPPTPAQQPASEPIGKASEGVPKPTVFGPEKHIDLNQSPADVPTPTATFGTGNEFKGTGKPMEAPVAPVPTTIPGPGAYGATNPFKGITKGTGDYPLLNNIPGKPAPEDNDKVNSLPGPGSSIPLIARNQAREGKDLDELDRLRSTGSGIHQIKNPFLRTLATIGDVAGTAMFPNAMHVIPGTSLHHADLVHGANAQVKEDQGLIDSNVSNRLKTAQANKAEQEDPNPEEWKTEPEFMGPNGEPIQTNKTTGETRIVSGQGIKPIVKGGAANSPIGDDKIDPLNQGLEARWQVLNPNKPLPANYKLPKGATEKDFERIDKLMQQTENAQGTVETRKQTQALREQNQTILKNAQEDREEKQGRKMVIGQDKNGNLVAVGAADAKSYGLTNVIEPGQLQAEKIINARNLLPLFNNNDKEDPGIIQLVDRLDKVGKLGIIASRWNEFMTGTLGQSLHDPDIEALRVKVGLGNTALMQVHVGNRGGAYLLEHFEDLVNSKKMDAENLRTGFRTEFNYIKHRAMMPGQTTINSNAMRKPGEENTNNPNPGEKSITMARAQQIAKEKNMTVDAVIKDAKAHGVKVK